MVWQFNVAIGSCRANLVEALVPVANDMEDCECPRWLESIVHVVRSYSFGVFAVAALVSSVCVFVYAQNETNKWKKIEEFEKLLLDEIMALGNSTEARILFLTREIKDLNSNLTSDINDLNSSSHEAIHKFRQDFINVQSDISGVKSDVQELRGSVTEIDASMKEEKSKVWAEFNKLEEEIKNLNVTRNGGSCRHFTGVHPTVVVISAITVLVISPYA